MHLHEDMTYLHFKYRLIGEKRQQQAEQNRLGESQQAWSTLGQALNMMCAQLCWKAHRLTAFKFWLDLTCLAAWIVVTIPAMRSEIIAVCIMPDFTLKSFSTLVAIKARFEPRWPQEEVCWNF